jgi:hypothetical protein
LIQVTLNAPSAWPPACCSTAAAAVKQLARRLRLFLSPATTPRKDQPASEAGDSDIRLLPPAAAADPGPPSPQPGRGRIGPGDAPPVWSPPPLEVTDRQIREGRLGNAAPAGPVGGVGLLLRLPAEGPPVVVEHVVRGGPAELSGLVRAGDRLVAVDGQVVTRASLGEIAAAAAGPAGSPVRLELMRAPGGGEVGEPTVTCYEADLKRAEVEGAGAVEPGVLRI